MISLHSPIKYVTTITMLLRPFHNDKDHIPNLTAMRMTNTNKSALWRNVLSLSTPVGDAHLFMMKRACRLRLMSSTFFIASTEHGLKTESDIHCHIFHIFMYLITDQAIYLSYSTAPADIWGEYFGASQTPESYPVNTHNKVSLSLLARIICKHVLTF